MTEVVERVELGGLALEVVRPAQPDALISEEAFADDEFLPYWAELWPSGVALARHLASLRLAGQRVLELGCGLGLPSLAAAAAGAEVLATDWAADALALLRRNAAANGLALGTALLRWDEPVALSGRRFPLVAAADVLYEERNALQLAALLPLVVETGGSALVADPGRRYVSAFLEEMSAAGWAIEVVPRAELPRGGIHGLRRRSEARPARTGG